MDVYSEEIRRRQTMQAQAANQKEKARRRKESTEVVLDTDFP
jgi:hypothetical protein